MSIREQLVEAHRLATSGDPKEALALCKTVFQQHHREQKEKKKKKKKKSSSSSSSSSSKPADSVRASLHLISGRALIHLEQFDVAYQNFLAALTACAPPQLSSDFDEDEEDLDAPPRDPQPFDFLLFPAANSVPVRTLLAQFVAPAHLSLFALPAWEGMADIAEAAVSDGPLPMHKAFAQAALGVLQRAIKCSSGKNVPSAGEPRWNVVEKRVGYLLRVARLERGDALQRHEDAQQNAVRASSMASSALDEMDDSADELRAKLLSRRFEAELLQARVQEELDAAEFSKIYKQRCDKHISKLQQRTEEAEEQVRTAVRSKLERQFLDKRTKTDAFYRRAIDVVETMIDTGVDVPLEGLDHVALNLLERCKRKYCFLLAAEGTTEEQGVEARSALVDTAEELVALGLRASASQSRSFALALSLTVELLEDVAWFDPVTGNAAADAAMHRLTGLVERVEAATADDSVPEDAFDVQHITHAARLFIDSVEALASPGVPDVFADVVELEKQQQAVAARHADDDDADDQDDQDEDEQKQGEASPKVLALTVFEWAMAAFISTRRYAFEQAIYRVRRGIQQLLASSAAPAQSLLSPLDGRVERVKDHLETTLSEAYIGVGPQKRDKALILLDRLLSRRPDDVRCLEALATYRLDAQEYAKADELASTLLEQNPRSRAALSVRGWVGYLSACGALGQASSLASIEKPAPPAMHATLLQAEQSLQDAIAANDVGGKAIDYLRLGFVKWKLGGDKRTNECREHFVTAAKRDPLFSTAFAALGLFYQHVDGKPAVAWRCFTKALALKPADPVAGCQVADILVHENDEDAADKLDHLYQSAVDSDPVASWAWLRMARAHLAGDEPDAPAAIVCYQNALRGFPRDLWCWEELGEAYLRQGKFNAAFKSFTRVLELVDTSEQQLAEGAYNATGMSPAELLASRVRVLFLRAEASRILSHSFDALADVASAAHLILRHSRAQDELEDDPALLIWAPCMTSMARTLHVLALEDMRVGAVLSARRLCVQALTILGALFPDDADVAEDDLASLYIDGLILEQHNDSGDLEKVPGVVPNARTPFRFDSHDALATSRRLVAHTAGVRDTHFFGKVKADLCFLLSRCPPSSMFPAALDSPWLSKSPLELCDAALDALLPFDSDPDDLCDRAVLRYHASLLRAARNVVPLSLDEAGPNSSRDQPGDDVAEALSLLQGALKQDPGNSRYWRILGLIHPQAAVRKHALARAAELGGAIAEDRALALDLLAFEYLADEREVARGCLEVAQGLDPSQSALWCGLGAYNLTLHSSPEAYRQAVAAFLQAEAEADGDQALASLGLGSALLLLGKRFVTGFAHSHGALAQAELSLRRASKLLWSRADVWLLHALAAEAAERPDAALESLGVAAGLADGADARMSALIGLHQGRILLASQQSSQAVDVLRPLCDDEAFKQLLAAAPPALSVLTSLTLGVALLATGDAEAEMHLRSAAAAAQALAPSDESRPHLIFASLHALLWHALAAGAALDTLEMLESQLVALQPTLSVDDSAKLFLWLAELLLHASLALPDGQGLEFARRLVEDHLPVAHEAGHSRARALQLLGTVFLALQPSTDSSQWSVEQTDRARRALCRLVHHDPANGFHWTRLAQFLLNTRQLHSVSRLVEQEHGESLPPSARVQDAAGSSAEDVPVSHNNVAHPSVRTDLRSWRMQVLLQSRHATGDARTAGKSNRFLAARLVHERPWDAVAWQRLALASALDARDCAASDGGMELSGQAQLVNRAAIGLLSRALDMPVEGDNEAASHVTLSLSCLDRGSVSELTLRRVLAQSFALVPGCDEAARGAHAQALELSATDAEAWRAEWVAAWVAVSEKRFSDAVVHYSQALGGVSDTEQRVRLLEEKAALHIAHLEQVGEGDAALTQAHELVQDATRSELPLYQARHRVLMRLARLYLFTKRYKKGLPAAEEALGMMPEDPASMLLNGIFARKLRRMGPAVKMLQDALQCHPPSAPVLNRSAPRLPLANFNLALVLHKQDDLRGAEAALWYELEFTNDVPAVYTWMANVYELQRQQLEASGAPAKEIAGALDRLRQSQERAAATAVRLSPASSLAWKALRAVQEGNEQQ